MTSSRPPGVPDGGEPARGSEPTRPVRLLVVDDHLMVIDGLRAMLSSHADRAVIVAATTDARQASKLVETARPDIALLDVRMREMSGLELCEQLLGDYPQLKVVLLTVYDDEQYLYRAMRAGARGFLTKALSAQELIGHLKRVMSGDTVVDPALAGRLALSAAQVDRGGLWAGSHLGLSQRESEVLGLLVEGLSNRAIAKALFIGDETVKTHVRSLLRKLGAADRTQAVATALREGLFR